VNKSPVENVGWYLLTADDSVASSKHHNPEVDGRKQTLGYVIRDCKFNDVQACRLYVRLIKG